LDIQFDPLQFSLGSILSHTKDKQMK